MTRPELHEWVRKLFHERTTQKLSVQALETLAVIAYKQPVTAPEIAEIRGVSSSGGVLSHALERHLIKTVGRKQVVGRPFMYATTREFLDRFGLNDLGDLPKVEEMSDALGFELPPALADPTATTSPLPFESATEEPAPVPETPIDETGTSVPRCQCGSGRRSDVQVRDRTSPLRTSRTDVHSTLHGLLHSDLDLRLAPSENSLLSRNRLAPGGRNLHHRRTRVGQRRDGHGAGVEGGSRRRRYPRRRAPGEDGAAAALHPDVQAPRLITSRSDPQRRPTVIDLLTKGGVREYVIRSGASITNQRIDPADERRRPRRASHPSEPWRAARVRGTRSRRPDRHALDRIARGVVLDGRKTAPAEIALKKVIEGEDGAQAVLSIVIREGRNRQVRNMCDAIGHPWCACGVCVSARSPTTKFVLASFASCPTRRSPRSRRWRRFQSLPQRRPETTTRRQAAAKGK